MHRWLTHGIDIHISASTSSGLIYANAPLTHSVIHSQDRLHLARFLHHNRLGSSHIYRAIRPHHIRPLTSTATCWACSVFVAFDVAYLHKRHLQMLGQIWTIHAWMNEMPPLGLNCVWGLLSAIWFMPGSLRSGCICSALHLGNLWSWENSGWTNLKEQTHNLIKKTTQLTMGTGMVHLCKWWGNGM